MKRSRRLSQRLVRTSLCAFSLVSCVIVLQFSAEFPRPVGARATRDAIAERAAEYNMALMPQGNGYTYSRSITIDHTKVPNSDQSNFPLLISGTYSYLATVANGGMVQNSNGYDIIFTSDSGCATKLDHEVETYSASTGAVNYWVKVPTVSHTTDTTFYMCYGNSGITTDQSNKTGVWDSNFKSVHHLPDGTTLSANDSTANAVNGTLENATATTGQVAGAASFNGSSAGVNLGNTSTWAMDSGDYTFEAWIKATSNPAAVGAILQKDAVGERQVALQFDNLFTANSINLIHFNDDGTLYWRQAPANSIAPNTWYHVAGVRSGTSLSIYIDGVSQTLSNPYSNGPLGTMKSAASVAYIGRDAYSGYESYFNGLIDEARVSNVARSADWIKTEYNNQSSPSTFYTISSSSGGGTYTYWRSITIDHTQVPNSDQSNFPVLISGTYYYLATVANGGMVQNSNGYDIIFTSDSGCATKLDHEVETYSASTGAVNYWVKVPTVSHTTDTTFYMCYRNASITSDQSNKTGVWDSNFKSVYHVPDGTTLSASDSTANAVNGTVENATATAGQISGGASFNGSSAGINLGNTSTWAMGSGNYTFEAWIKVTSNPASVQSILQKDAIGERQVALMFDNYFNTNCINLIHFNEDGTFYWRQTPANSLTTNAWHHVAGVRSSSSLLVYIDGVSQTLSSAYTNGPLGTMKSAASAAYIGRNTYSGYEEYFNGLIDEARVSNNARSADWIKTEYNNQSSPSTFYAISAASGNQPPVANAGGPYSGVTGTAVSFSGSSSSDPDGTVANYSWNFGDSNSASGVSPTHTYATAGSYTVTLTVTDDLGATNSATTTATISNRPPVANAGGPYTGVTGMAVSFSGSSSSDPDGTIDSYAWNFGDYASGSSNTASGVSPTHTYATAGSYTVTLTVTDDLGATNSATTSITVAATLDARLDPLNRTGGGGEDPLSRNFNWSIPLVGLPGRGGLDLGLSLAYNSLATWTRHGNAISFDDDRGSPSPGFRLGFPVIQGAYYNSQVSKYSFIMVTPSGSRIELRQVGTSTLYQSVDSSYLLFDPTAMTLKTTTGTQLSYVWKNGEYECSLIKDRNGNYLTIHYDTNDRIDYIDDTLSRRITFNYNTNNSLGSITQTWAGTSHSWAIFTYANKTIQTNFTGLTVYGPVYYSTIHALSQVKFADDSHYDFDYTSWGQVWKISQYTGETNPTHLLNYRSYNLPADNSTAQTDCPRFTVRHDWAENWNRDTNGDAQEVNTYFDAPVDTALPDNSLQAVTMAKITSPDGTSQKIYFAGSVTGGAGSAPAWKRGLPLLTDTYESGNSTSQRSATTAWTQDDENVVYQLNPRVIESNIIDPAGNHARTSIDYAATTLSDGTTINLPQNTYEYDATTQLRRTHIAYNLASEYTSRHIIGLVSEQTRYGGPSGSETLMSKVSYQYDESGSIQGTDAPVRHDNWNYTATFRVGRGNVSSVTRYDVSSTAYTTSTMQYNTAGAVVAILDPLSHGVTISYADSFSDDNNSRNTLAYPTTVTDPDGYSASVRYNYDFGAATWKQTPLPNVTDNQPGPQQVISFDSIGRLDRVTSLVNNAYTRYIYGPNYVETFATVNTVADEAHSLQVFDGHGRVIAKASNHPGSVGGFSGQLFIYDQMGQMVKTSNPTETSITISNPPMSLQPYSWAAAGDDAQAGWVYTQQTYDWKGRPLMTTNPSTTGNPADSTTKSAGYSGCGCAGGDVVTLTDEGTIDGGVAKRRQKKIYSDVLGRTVKTEVLNWEGGSVYSTTLNTYNARDQITLIRQFQGTAPSDLNDLSCPSGTCQKTTMAFDGYGRLQTKHVPEQQVDPNNSSSTDHTTYSYNNDDKVYTATDARGAVTTYGYNNRQLVKSVSHALSAHSTINVSYNYDAAGNRTSMSHTVAGAAQDSASYSYDQLSRLMSETRHLDALTGYSMGGNYTIGYGYTLSGELQSITDPFDSTINYSYDAVGRTSTVTGSAYGGVTSYASNVQYRAWGAVKAADFGDGQSESVPQFNARMRPTQFRTGNSQNSGYRYDYSYYDDGRLSQVRDLDDKVGDPRTVQFHYMSRVYAYDQAARIGGVTAMNPNPNGNAIPAPFTGNYGYDAFSNLTSRSGHYALNSDQSDSATYTNNRRVQTGWSYDADGRILTSTDNSDVAGSSARSWSYDAAGEEISVAQTAAGVTATDTMTYDGDGQLIYESVANQSTATTAYLIHSTVLESVLTKLDATGNKNTTYVPANGLVSPLQQKDNQGNPTMYWVHRDALGVQENGAAYDPFGALISNVQPPVFTPPPNQPFYGPSYSGSGSSSFTNANNFSVGCQMDGIAASCATVLRAIDHGWPGTVIISTTGGMAELANLGIFVSVSPAQPSNSGPPTLKPSTMKENPERNRNPYGIGDDEGLQYVINISFSSDLLDGDPQNSDFVPLPNLRKGIDALARLGDCGQYIQSLINKVAEGTGNPFVSDYITDLFDTISSQGGVAFRQADPARSETGGTVSGMIKGGDATIIITPQPSGEGSATARTLTPYGLRSTVYLYFIAAIHESIHLAGLNRRYSDRQLAEAAHALNDKSYLPNDPRNVSANSDAWNSELMKHCPGPKE